MTYSNIAYAGADPFIQKDDWIGIYCNQLPLPGTFDINLDPTTIVQANDGAPGIMAFAQIKDKNQVANTFMGVYSYGYTGI